MPGLTSLTPKRAEWLASLTEKAPVVLRHQTRFEEPAEVIAIKDEGGTQIITIATSSEQVQFVRDTGHLYSERSFRSIEPVTPEFRETWKKREDLLNDPTRPAWLASLEPGLQVILHLPTGDTIEEVGRCNTLTVRVSGHGNPNFYFFNRETGYGGPAAQIWISPATPEIVAAIEEGEAREETYSRVKSKFDNFGGKLSLDQLMKVEQIIDQRIERRDVGQNGVFARGQSSALLPAIQAEVPHA